VVGVAHDGTGAQTRGGAHAAADYSAGFLNEHRFTVSKPVAWVRFESEREKHMLALTIVTLLAAEPFETGPVRFDIASLKANLAVLSDGKGHYLVYNAKAVLDGPTFYGDMKAMHRIRVAGGGSSGTESWNLSIWDPRTVMSNDRASLSMRDEGKEFQGVCGKKTITFTPAPAEEGKKLLDSDVFKGPLWTRKPERLLRDNQGTYYFIDRLRSDDDAERRDFVFFKGPRGKMKTVKLKDIVDDSKGLILATSNGQLRLVSDQTEPFWVQGKSRVQLIDVPLDDNRNVQLVYSELGVYDGQKLGTPCDDAL
jgi:hypothetical protein